MITKDGELREYDNSCTSEYIANLSEYDGEWHIDWISEKGDSLQHIAEKDINLAIQEAYQWCVKAGLLWDLDTPKIRLKEEIKEVTGKLSELIKCMNDSLSESEKDILRKQYAAMFEYRNQLKKRLALMNKL